MKNFIIAIMILFLSTVSGAEVLTVEAEGMGATKEVATLDAKRNALAQGIGQILMSETKVENFMVSSDKIVTQTMGHVSKYDVINESNNGGLWTIKIKAQVARDGLLKDLMAKCFLKEALGNPRIVFLLDEKTEGKATTNLETILIQQFKDACFEVVDPNQTLRFRESPEAVAALGGDPAAAAKLGQSVNAELMILGNVRADESDMSDNPYLAGTGMKSVAANLNLKAVDVTNRKILASSTETGVAAHISVTTGGLKAITTAAQKVMTKKGAFFDLLLSAWNKSTKDGKSFEITINGVTSFKLSKNSFKAISAKVISANRRGFNKPKLVLDVKFLGNIESLCEVLDGLQAGEHSLSVESYQGSKISLSLAKTAK